LTRHSLPATDKVNYKELSKTIIQQDTVSDQMLTAESFQLPHFFLISAKNFKKILSEDYLKKVLENWKETARYSRLELPKFTYLQFLYQNYQYDLKNKLYRSISTNQFFPNSVLKLRIFRYLDYSIYRLGYYDQNLNLTRNILLPLSRYLNDEESELSIKKLYGVYLYSIGKL